MDKRIFIKPTPQPAGEPPLKVRKPVNGHLAAAGEWMQRETYWLRRLADGDVVETPAPDPVEVAGWLASTAPDVAAPAKVVTNEVHKFAAKPAK